MRGKPQDHWDIFCNVIDNYGDIGVCWRLARQLVAEHGLRVRLWVDDPASFRPLCPELDPALAAQGLSGVDVRHWRVPFPSLVADDVADVVIEAFACELPEPYLAAMAARPRQPAWINLEYLSAEDWVAGCHGLASPHPRLPLTKHFFFPGFTPGSGGLLREARLFERRDAWQANPAAARAHLGLPPAAPDELLVSLFSYENPALPALLQAWAGGPRPLRCLVPQGRVLAQVAAWLGQTALQPGESINRGRLTVHALPFVRQEDYDLLLWTCDLNFVRGEDSFVRAQWAAHPLVWHIYPQAENAHLPKLTAFLDAYCATLAPAEATALREFWLAWNGAGGIAIERAWNEFARHPSAVPAHARAWAGKLAEQPGLAAKLVFFCEKLL